MKTIYMGNGTTVSLASYIEGWKKALALDQAVMVKAGPGAWWPQSVAQVLEKLRRGMHERINRHVAGYGKGRKWSHEWQAGARQLTDLVNYPHMIVRPGSVPPEFRDRLKDRITLAWEE